MKLFPLYDVRMLRDPASHKGENGKVCIIGGSRHIHGAPLFSALAAEASGVDLIYLFVPPAHEEVAKQASLNFQVRTFQSDELSTDDVGPILQMLASMDCALIGPGLGHEPPSLRALRQIITGAPCPLVLDASALQADTLSWITDKQIVLTPHLGELERMGIAELDLPEKARHHSITILLKAPIDRIVSPDGSVVESAGGNAGLTVGGTGDALAGLTAGLIAQHLELPEAALLASITIKKAGEMLAEQQGMHYMTLDVIEMIPLILQHD